LVENGIELDGTGGNVEEVYIRAVGDMEKNM
jgi:hypothetical protein